MKHNVKITLLLLGMFIAAQLIGLAVIHAYSPRVEQVVNATSGVVENITITPQLPYAMQPPEIKPEISLLNIIFSLIFVTLIIIFLSRIRARFFMKAWFFTVVVLTSAITINAFLQNRFNPSALLAFVIAFPLAYYKVFQRNLLIHNFSELLIYPGIAVVFVSILNFWTAFILLVAISIWDIYAVWHSKIMQRMAQFQIQELGIFAGFFVPYMSRKDKMRMKMVKLSAADKKRGVRKGKEKRIRVSLAILGGGDVAFPLIFAGVLLRASGLVSALLVVLFSVLALLLLFLFSKRGKFYPAMPFLTAGCFAGWLAGLLIQLI